MWTRKTFVMPVVLLVLCAGWVSAQVIDLDAEPIPHGGLGVHLVLHVILDVAALRAFVGVERHQIAKPPKPRRASRPVSHHSSGSGCQSPVESR